MLRREIPHQVHEGRVLYLSRSRLAPALPADGDVLTPLHPWQPWTSDMQPLCYWQDEPVALQLAAKPGDEWIDGRQWMGELPSEWYALLSTALQVGAWLENHRFAAAVAPRPLSWQPSLRCIATPAAIVTIHEFRPALLPWSPVVRRCCWLVARVFRQAATRP